MLTVGGGILTVAREEQLKGYSRAKKDALINSKNLEWIELTGKKDGIPMGLKG